MTPLPRSLVAHPLLSKLDFSAALPETWTLLEAQGYCRRLTRIHYENFTVASWLVPARYRQSLADLYAFCRWADDLADESTDADLSREWLDWWADQLALCWEGKATHPVFVALDASRRQFHFSRSHFEDLLTAFRRDQRQTRYDSWSDVLDYCRGSANPVGRLVLEMADCRSPARDAWSDAICSGLQIANFCQDVAGDYRRGRIYLPREAWLRHGCQEKDFARGEANAPLRDLVREGVDLAERLLSEGRPLLEETPNWLRHNLVLFTRGGSAILRAIRRRRYDVWSRRPTVSRWDKWWIGARAAWGLLARRASSRLPHRGIAR